MCCCISWATVALQALYFHFVQVDGTINFTSYDWDCMNHTDSDSQVYTWKRMCADVSLAGGKSGGWKEKIEAKTPHIWPLCYTDHTHRRRALQSMDRDRNASTWTHLKCCLASRSHDFRHRWPCPACHLLSWWSSIALMKGHMQAALSHHFLFLQVQLDTFHRHLMQLVNATVTATVAHANDVHY